MLGKPEAKRHRSKDYINKCIASSNKCLTSSNKKLVGTSATLLGTSASLVVTFVFSCLPGGVGRRGEVARGS